MPCISRDWRAPCSSIRSDEDDGGGGDGECLVVCDVRGSLRHARSWRLGSLGRLRSCSYSVTHADFIAVVTCVTIMFCCCWVGDNTVVVALVSMMLLFVSFFVLLFWPSLINCWSICNKSASSLMQQLLQLLLLLVLLLMIFFFLADVYERLHSLNHFQNSACANEVCWKQWQSERWWNSSRNNIWQTYTPDDQHIEHNRSPGDIYTL